MRVPFHILKVVQWLLKLNSLIKPYKHGKIWLLTLRHSMIGKLSFGLIKSLLKSRGERIQLWSLELMEPFLIHIHLLSQRCSRQQRELLSTWISPQENQ